MAVVPRGIMAALHALDRLVGIVAARYGAPLAVKFVEPSGGGATYTGIDVANDVSLMQRKWFPSGPDHHTLQVRHYRVGSDDHLLFSVGGREYHLQDNRVVGSFIGDNWGWTIRNFTDNSVTFRAGDRYLTKQHDFTFNINE